MLPRSDRPPQARLRWRQSLDPPGAVRKQTRYFALKLPIAADAKTATFAYVDPGNTTDTELRSWGAAHEWLWRGLYGEKGRWCMNRLDPSGELRAGFGEA